MLKFLLFKAQSSFSYFWQCLVSIYTWLGLRLLLPPYSFCSGFIKHYFFKFLGNLVVKYWRVMCLASHCIIIHIIATLKFCVTVAFFCLVFIDIVFSLWSRPADLHILFRYFGKTPILSSCISLIVLNDGILAEYEFCRMLGFPPRTPVSYRAFPTHPYLLFITSDWTVALETVIMSQVTSLWLNEGKKNRTKEHIPASTCNLETETVSHTFSYFRAVFGSSIDLSC